ncbi:PSP1 C-terminal conserved region-domain-containing protein [Dipodascopsis uninucleata]
MLSSASSAASSATLTNHNEASDSPGALNTDISGLGGVLGGPSRLIPALSRVDDSSSSISSSENEDDLSFALDTAFRGGISAMSSRRPSYAAEFASRPRGAAFGLNILSPTTSHPSQPSIDSDRWLAANSGQDSRSSFAWSLWSDNNPVSAATTASLPQKTSTADRTLQPNYSKTYRSLSFTQDSPSSSSSHSRMLSGQLFPSILRQDIEDVFEDDDFADDAFLRARTTSSSGAAGVPPGQNLKRFNPVVASNPWSMDPAMAASRRYSFDSFGVQNMNHMPLPPQPGQMSMGMPHMQSSVHANAAPGTVPRQMQPPGVMPPGLPNSSGTSVAPVSSNMVSGAGAQSMMGLPSNTTANGTSATTTSFNSPAESNEFYRTLCREVDPYFRPDENRAVSHRHIIFEKASTTQTPTLPYSPPYPTTQRLYCVEFKAGRLDVFYIPEGSGLVVKYGDLVIVDADRGKDLGKVTHENVSIEAARRLKILQHQEQQAALQQNMTQDGSVKLDNVNLATILQPKQILRFAQPMEIQQIFVKKIDEEKAQKMCMAKVEERGMAMQVRDAEYQWDRRKLTFFYTASHRIDFRDLVRDLFRLYKTRIWMCAVNV